jgi:hypothetical protein
MSGKKIIDGLREAIDMTRLVAPGEIERAVWSAMIWAALEAPPPDGKFPEYTDSGNSFAEKEARRAAARIVSALDPAALAAMVAEARANALREAAEFVTDEAASFPDSVAWCVHDLAKAILALIDKEPQT